MHLSKHFTLAEFTRSDKARQLGNANEPDNPQILENLKRLAEAMELVRGLFGVPIDVSSGYRNKVVNEAVGGVPNSDHAMGLAVDFLPRGFTVADTVKRIRESGIKFDQLIDEPSWVHFGLGAGMRQQVLRARRTGPKGKMVYNPI